MLSSSRNYQLLSPQGDTQGHQIRLYPIKSGPRYHFLENPGCSNAAAGILRIWGEFKLQDSLDQHISSASGPE